MAQTALSIYSPKGGAGKSTVAIHLSDCIVAKRQKSVLIIDRDNQGSIGAVARLAESKGNPLPFATHQGVPKSRPTQDVILIDHSPLIGQQFMPPQGTTLVILPVQPSFLDFASMQQAKGALEAQGLKTLIVLNRYKSNVNSHRDLYAQIHSQGWPVIAERTIYQSSIGQGKGVFSSPVSHSGVREARNDMSLLLEAIEKSIGRPL